MGKRYVIPPGELPAKLPIGGTIILWLLLDRVHAAGWVWGAAGVLWLLVWVAAIYDIVRQEQRSAYESAHNTSDPLTRKWYRDYVRRGSGL